MRTRDQGYVTNMIRAGTDTANYDRGTTEDAARLEDDRIDHKCQAEGILFSPKYGNIAPRQRTLPSLRQNTHQAERRYTCQVSPEQPT